MIGWYSENGEPPLHSPHETVETPVKKRKVKKIQLYHF